MPTRPHAESSSSDAPSPEFSDVLYQSLSKTLAKQCARRYDVTVTIPRQAAQSEDDSELRVEVQCAGLIQMPVRLTVRHAGGNIYDVRCTVEEGSSHRFSHSLPAETKSSLSYDPYLGQEIATFLREEMEKRLGRLLLQSPAAPPLKSTSTLS